MLYNIFAHVPQDLHLVFPFSARHVLKINVIAYWLFKLKFKMLAAVGWRSRNKHRWMWCPHLVAKKTNDTPPRHKTKNKQNKMKSKGGNNIGSFLCPLTPLPPACPVLAESKELLNLSLLSSSVGRCFLFGFWMGDGSSSSSLPFL